MNAQQLKNSILQMAVQGKLVPQDPNDEPASVLLERIRKEKEKLIKEGKIKKDKNPSYIFRGEDNLPYEKVGKNVPVCIVDEVLFEIPDTWRWERFGNIMINKDSERIPLSVSERSNLNKIYDYYGASGIIDKVDNYLFDKPLLLIGEDGANLLNRSTPIAFIAEGKYWVNNHAHVLDAPEGILLSYMALYINSISLAKYVTGTAQPKMNQANMNSILVPVPPTNEQGRIIDAINDITPYVDNYRATSEKLQELNLRFPNELKKSILQQAVMGKLVPQDPNDEPASVLLEKICAEKDALIKAGKLKKGKYKSIIYRNDNSYYEKLDDVEICIDDEIPFDIPTSWEWVRLYNISNKITDGTHNSPVNTATGDYLYISAKNIKDEGVSLSNVTYVTKEVHDEIYSRCNPEKGDVLLIKDGATTGVVTVNDLLEPFSLLSSVALIKLNKLVNPWYLVYVLRSDIFQKTIKSQMKGTGITRLTLKQIEPVLIPIPPLQEQNRIVTRIVELMSCNERINRI